MGLNKLDLLSIAPKNFIFKSKSNKSILGGFLTLIFIMITFIIFAYYLINFITEQNYSVEYVFYDEFVSLDETEKRLEEERYNPYFDFNFDLFNYETGVNLPEEYILFNDTDGEIIPRQTLLHKKISDINMYVSYLCNDEDENCTIPNPLIFFLGNYTGYVLDHQNDSTPLYQVDLNENKTIVEGFTAGYTMIIEYTWKLVKYKKEAGFSKFWNNLKGEGEEDQKIIGMTGAKSLSFYDYDKIGIFEYNGVRMRILGQLIFRIDYEHYDEYNRTKKSILDLISKVFSLSLAVFKGLSLFLKLFYSNNFDNYKIVENILYDLKPPKITKTKKVELINIENKIDSLLPKNDSENMISINEGIEEENFDNEDQGNNNSVKIEESYIENKRKLPKLRFIDFIFNNIYKCKCCKNNKQEIISKCNELITKYYSVDAIIYYQLKLENLLKDYKWNNPELIRLDKNELIIQLNNLISNYENN